MPIYEDDMTHWIWDNALRYKWWTEIRFRSAKRPVNRYVGGTNIRVALTYGEWAVTMSYLASHWDADQRSIKSFLDALEDDGMIKTRKEGLITIISVCDFNKYCFNIPHNGDSASGATFDKEANETDDIEESMFGPMLESTYTPMPALTQDSTLPLMQDKTQAYSYNKEEKKKSLDRSRVREEEFVNQIKNSKSSLESIALPLHCTIDRIIPLLTDFFNSMAACEQWHNSLPSFKKHFLNWARIQLQKEQQNEISSKK